LPDFPKGLKSFLKKQEPRLLGVLPAGIPSPYLSIVEDNHTILSSCAEIQIVLIGIFQNVSELISRLLKKYFSPKNEKTPCFNETPYGIPTQEDLYYFSLLK
jgi:hypothetical protein